LRIAAKLPSGARLGKLVFVNFAAQKAPAKYGWDTKFADRPKRKAKIR
jgi:hypothetical protein